jgi:Thiolase, C-terminal domain
VPSATVVRILATMLPNCTAGGSRCALETLCIGGGHGIAAVFERASRSGDNPRVEHSPTQPLVVLRQ